MYTFPNRVSPLQRCEAPCGLFYLHQTELRRPSPLGHTAGAPPLHPPGAPFLRSSTEALHVDRGEGEACTGEAHAEPQLVPVGTEDEDSQDDDDEGCDGDHGPQPGGGFVGVPGWGAVGVLEGGVGEAVVLEAEAQALWDGDGDGPRERVAGHHQGAQLGHTHKAPRIVPFSAFDPTSRDIKFVSPHRNSGMESVKVLEARESWVNP